jgi:hypothetical protein
VQDVLGFVNQSTVLCAVARELGVTDRRQQVRLLGAVRCDRDLDPGGLDEANTSELGLVLRGWTPTGLGKALWHLAGLMRAIGDELVSGPVRGASSATSGCSPRQAPSLITSVSTARSYARPRRDANGSPGMRVPSEPDSACGRR